MHILTVIVGGLSGTIVLSMLSVSVLPQVNKKWSCNQFSLFQGLFRGQIKLTPGIKSRALICICFVRIQCFYEKTKLPFFHFVQSKPRIFFLINRNEYLPRLAQAYWMKNIHDLNKGLVGYLDSHCTFFLVKKNIFTFWIQD